MSDHPADDWTLEQARDWLREQALDGGATCPCCRRWAQVYRWSLYATAVVFLAKLYRAGGTSEFVHSKSLEHKGQGDAARLRFWGLVEHEPDRRPDGGKSGWWRVTAEGERFLLGKRSIQKYVFVYAARPLWFEGEPVTVRGSLREFDYDAMMRGEFGASS